MSNQNTVTPGLAIFERLAPLGYPLIRITAGLMLIRHVCTHKDRRAVRPQQCL